MKSNERTKRLVPKPKRGSRVQEMKHELTRLTRLKNKKASKKGDGDKVAE